MNAEKSIEVRAIGMKVGVLRKGLRLGPLLSNLYMRRFVLGWKKLGYEKCLKAYVVNYADDLVICCRDQAEEALATMRNIHAEAEVNGERNEDAGLQAAGREIRFSGVYVWTLLLAADGAGLLGHHSVQEAGHPHLRGDQQRDWTE
jgi:hypothetical protein